MFGEFDILVKMRRNLKTKMGLCFVKGQYVQVRRSPAEFLNGFEVVGERFEAIHPLFEDGKNPKVTVAIPLKWVEVV
jgi:hypothetical protein